MLPGHSGLAGGAGAEGGRGGPLLVAPVVLEDGLAVRVRCDGFGVAHLGVGTDDQSAREAAVVGRAVGVVGLDPARPRTLIPGRESGVDQLDAAGTEWPAEAEEAFKAPIRQQYETQGNPYYSTARLWDDGVIDPLDTRMVVGLALGVAGQAPLGPVRYGVFRM